MRVTGELIFSTDRGGKRTVRVPDPTGGITETALNLAANRIISANPFDETVGELKALVRADRVVVDRTPLLP